MDKLLSEEYKRVRITKNCYYHLFYLIGYQVVYLVYLYRLIFKSNRSSFDTVGFPVEVEFWARTLFTDEIEIFTIRNSRIKVASSFTILFYLAYKR